MYYGTPPIITSGLISHFDSFNSLSYTSGSNIWNSVGYPQISASLFTSSFSNNILNFDGTSSYANLNLISLSGSFTLSLVFNTRITPSSSFEGRESLISQNSSSFEIRGIELSSTSSIGFRNLGAYMSEDYPSPTLLPNRFYNIAIVRTSNNTINTYVNGVRTDLGIINTQFPSTVTIDSLANQILTRYFNGAINNFSVYNRALSESEIRQNVASLNGRYNFDTTLQPPPLTNSLIETLRVKADGEGSNFQSDIMSSSLADLNRINNLGLLESASLVITPATYKEGLIYNIKPRISTYNLLLSTETFTGSYWSRSNQNTTRGFLAPNGTNTATLFESTGTVVRMNQNILLQPNIPYNVSWYISQSNTQYAYINVIDSAENIGSAALVDFTNKTIQAPGGGGANSLLARNYQLTEEPNGWYRASIDITPSASVTNRLYKTWVLPNTASNNRFGTQSGSAVYIWGAQVTKGSGVLPYQPIISSSTQDVIYTRSTTATTIDRNGYVTQVPYNLVTNTNNGLSIGGGTVVRNAAIAPDGTQTADIFTKTGSLTISQDISLGLISPHSGSYYTLSFWTKLTDTGSNIPISTEIFIFSGSTPILPQITSSYTITNQWQKVETTFQITNNLVSYLSVRPARESNSTGPLIGRSFSIWGLQLTKGSGSLDYQSNFTRLNHPAIDYSAGVPAIRASVSSENYFRWSNDLTNPVWIKTGLTVATSSFLSPSGEYNTFTLTATASNASIKQFQDSGNRVSLFSVYIRRKTGTGPIVLSVGGFSSSIQPTSEWGRYQASGFRFTGSYTASSGNYTVNTTIPHGFEVGDIQGFGVGTNAFAQINSAVTSTPTPTSYTFTSGTTTASGSCTVSPRAGKLTIVNQGDEIDVWGPQSSGTGYAEANIFATFPDTNYVKDFVPTTTAATTRNNENLTLSNLSSSIQTNSSSGSFYIEFALPHTVNGFYTTGDLINFFDPNGNNFLRLDGIVYYNIGAQAFRWRYVPNSIVTAVTGNVKLLQFNKLLLVMTSSSMKFFFNGTQVGTAVALPSPNISLDRIATVSPYLLTKSLLYFPHALTDSQAIALTT